MAINPRKLGVPADEWRSGQWKTVRQLVSAKQPVTFYSGPTGSGKSYVAYGALQFMKARGGVVTADIGLQEQYANTLDIRSMKGRSHFPCIVMDYATAEQGPCVGGEYCHEKVSLAQPFGGCPYYRQRHDALLSSAWVTNYAMYMALVGSGGLPYGPYGVDVVVADEGHKLESSLIEQMSVDLRVNDLRYFKVPLADSDWKDIDSLIAWARRTLDVVSIAKSGANKRDRAKAGKLESSVSLLASLEHGTENWIILEQKWGLEVKPLFIADYFHSYFTNIALRVIVMSATLPDEEYLAWTLGLSSEQWGKVASPMLFTKERRPIRLPLEPPKVSARDEESYIAVVQLVDDFLDMNENTKGLIHTGNYALQDMLRKLSRHNDRIVYYKTESRREAIEQFRNSGPGTYLAGPSLTEGIDLPYDHVQNQLLMKLPIPNRADRWVRAREEVDKEWSGFVTATQVVQAYGRGMRAEDDNSEFWILDGNFEWHSKRFRKFYPWWFREAISYE